MNQITRYLIILLSLVFIQARASYVSYQENDVGKEIGERLGLNEELTAQLTSQASLLTQFATARDAGYQNQQALNQWNRQLHVDEIKFLQELGHEKEIKIWLETLVGHPLSPDEMDRYLMLGALYSVDIDWQNAIDGRAADEVALIQSIGQQLRSLSVINGRLLQYEDRSNAQWYFTSDDAQFKDRNYGNINIVQDKLVYHEYRSMLEKARLAPEGNTQEFSLYDTGALLTSLIAEIPGGVKDGLVSIGGSAYMIKDGIASYVSDPKAIAAALHSGEAQYKIATQLEKLGLNFVLQREIYDLQGDSTGYSKFIGAATGRLGGNLLLGAGTGVAVNASTKLIIPAAGKLINATKLAASSVSKSNSILKSSILNRFRLNSTPLRVTQYYDPKKGAFPIDGKFALLSEVTKGNYFVDGIKVPTTWVAPYAESEMSMFRRLLTGVGLRRNYVEFDVLPGELVNPSRLKSIFVRYQQTIPGQVDLTGRNPVFGKSGFNWVIFPGIPVAGAAAGGYLYYKSEK
jgi:hypothetical protein